MANLHYISYSRVCFVASDPTLPSYLCHFPSSSCVTALCVTANTPNHGLKNHNRHLHFDVYHYSSGTVILSQGLRSLFNPSFKPTVRMPSHVAIPVVGSNLVNVASSLPLVNGENNSRNFSFSELEGMDSAEQVR